MSTFLSERLRVGLVQRLLWLITSRAEQRVQGLTDWGMWGGDVQTAGVIRHAEKLQLGVSPTKSEKACRA